MSANIEQLGKLSLAILQNYVKTILGEEFTNILRAPTDQFIAVQTALRYTEDRFTKQFQDRLFAKRIFKQEISASNQGLLADALGKYYEHPTDPDFPAAIRRIFTDSLPHIPTERIDTAVADYIEILTEELALADKKFAENVRTLAHLHQERHQLEQVGSLKRIEEFLRAGKSEQHPPTILTSRFTIPAPVTYFTGRTTELDELKSAFSRGVLITGSGGIGKTELAHKLAQELADQFPDARLKIDLLGTSLQPLTSEDAMRQLLNPFYPGEKFPDDPRQLFGLYQQTFSSYKALLILDNASNCAQVKLLIPPSPSAAIVTSRQHFNLNEFHLHPLRLDVFSPNQARDLLCKAAPKIQNATDPDLNHLAALCGHLPIALRVAASLLADRDDWTLTTLRNRLSDERTRLQRLKRPEDQDLDVEATLNLSYTLLSPDLQKYFRYLSVFPAPFSMTSASAVWDLSNNDDPDDIIGKLINRSILNFLPVKEDNGGSYDLHDLTRLFAMQRLQEDQAETKEAIARHASHFLNLASTANDEYKKGGEHVLIGLNLFRSLWQHLIFAYIRLLPEQNIFPRPDTADRWLSDFPVRCVYVLDLHLPPHERVPLLQKTLEAARRIEDRCSEAYHLGYLGVAYAALGDAHKAIQLHEQSLAIHLEIRDRRGEGNALGNLGAAYADLGDPHKAIQFYEQALVIDCEIGDRRGEGNALGNLGAAYADLGDTQTAIQFYERALVIVCEIGDRRGEGAVLGKLGAAYADLGDTQTAIQFYEQALAIDREIGDRRGEGADLGNLGLAYAESDESEKAIVCAEQLTELAEAQEDYGSYLDIGNIYSRLDQEEKACEAYGKAIQLAPQIAMLYRNRASILINLKKWQEASADLAEAEKLEPGNLYLLDRKGDLAFWQSQFPEAVRCYRQALAKKDDPEWHLDLALALLGAGENQQAMNEFNLAHTHAEGETINGYIKELTRAKSILPDPTQVDEMISRLNDKQSQTNTPPASHPPP